MFCVETLKTSSNKPYRRQGTVSAIYEDYLYVFGGRTSSKLGLEEHKGKQRALLKDLSRCSLKGLDNPESLTASDEFVWENINYNANLKARHNHASVVWKNFWLIFGGVTYDGYQNELLVFDFNTLEFVKWECGGTVPTPRGGHILERIDNHVFVHGGSFAYKRRDKKNKDKKRIIPYHDDTYCLNLDTKQWSKVETEGYLPRPRNWHSSTTVTYKDVPYLVIFGGYWWNGSEHYLNDLSVLNLEKKTWKRLDAKRRPHRRNRCSLIVQNGYFVVQGGNFYPDPVHGDLFFKDARYLPVSAIDSKTPFEWKELQAEEEQFLPNSEVLKQDALVMAHFTWCEHESGVITFGGEVKHQRNNNINLIRYKL